MIDYLTNLIARNRNEVETIQPRVPSRFEPQTTALHFEMPEFAATDGEIVGAINRHVDRYVADTGYGLFRYGFEEFLIKRYRPAAQDQFPPHVDISSRNSMHRMLALLIYLNDVASGGETGFNHLLRDNYESSSFSPVIGGHDVELQTLGT